MKKLFGVFKRSLMRYFTKEKPDIHAEEAKTSSFCTNAITDVLETDGKGITACYLVGQEELEEMK